MRTIVFALSLCFSFPIDATISWSAIQELALPGVVNYEMTIDSQGNEFAIWHSKNGAIETSFKPYQGEWTEPILIATVPHDESHLAIISNAIGEVHALWIEKDKDNVCCLKTAFRSLNETWSTPKTLASGLCEGIKLSIDPLGNLYAIWRKLEKKGGFFSQDKHSIQVAEKKCDMDWSLPRDLIAMQKFGIPEIQADNKGNVYAIWSNLESEPYIQGAQKLSGNLWEKAYDVFMRPGVLWGYNNMSAYRPHLRINSLGDVLAICCYIPDNLNSRVAFTEKKYSENSWSTPRIVSPETWYVQYCWYPDFAVDQEENVFVAWLSWRGGKNSIIESAQYSASTGWTEPVQISLDSPFKKRSTAYYPKVLTDYNGHAIVLWGSNQDEQFAVQCAVHTTEKGWSQTKAASLNADLTYLSASMDSFGNVHVSWLEGPEGQMVIKTMMGNFNEERSRN